MAVITRETIQLYNHPQCNENFKKYTKKGGNMEEDISAALS